MKVSVMPSVENEYQKFGPNNPIPPGLYDVEGYPGWLFLVPYTGLVGIWINTEANLVSTQDLAKCFVCNFRKSTKNINISN